MSRIKNGIRIFAMTCICVLGLLGFSMTASADTFGTIQLNFPIQGTTFSVYQVGVYTTENQWELVDELAMFNIDWTGKDAATTLAAYVLDQQLSPVQTATTDENGVVIFEGLEHAAYLVVGEVTTVDHTTYTPSPVLLSLPQEKNGTLDWYAEINDKYTTREFTELKVVKVWEGDNEKKRPTSVEIKLYCDKEMIETVVLNADNNWTAEWPDLDGGHIYTVVEENVPENYKVTITKNDSSVVVTNTYDNPAISPDKPGDNGGTGGNHGGKLPQTGQLWWPVGILICMGLFLVMMGLMLRKDRNN